MPKVDKELLKLAREDFRRKLRTYESMTRYYEGESDAIRDYKMITDRSQLRIRNSFLKYFVDQEVSYTLGNDITYASISDDKEFLAAVKRGLRNLDSAHDINLLQNMLIHSIAYELYYLDRDGDFAARVIPATEGYAAINDYGEVEFFMHFYRKNFDTEEYIDVYTDEYIYHYDKKLNEIAPRDPHIFGEVPVGVATWDRERTQIHKTNYGTIKWLQDAYETVLSDLVNELSDMRNAYMVFEGAQIDEEDLPRMKEQGIIQIPESDGSVSWLLKDLKGNFIHDSLEILADNMYQLSGHINRNEMNNRNESFLALEAKNMTLQSKCKLHQKALEDAIDKRIKMLVRVMQVTGSDRDYDYKDIYPIFVPNLPSDDFSTAEMIDKLGDRISTQTAIEQLSFVEDSESELERIRKELEEMYGGDYEEDFEDVVVGDDDEESNS